MGIYYSIFNHTKKQWLSGDSLNFGIKRVATFDGFLPHLLMRMIEREEIWANCSIEIIDDTYDDLYDELEEEYKELTFEDLKKYLEDLVDSHEITKQDLKSMEDVRIT